MKAWSLIRKRFFFGGKVAELNFGKLYRYRRVMGNYGQNSVIA